MKVLLSVCLFFAPILAAPYAGTFLGDDTPSISGGDDFNVGPSEVAQEEHAKLEEAAQKALSIIEHAGKYMDDSIKEQSKRSVESYIARDIEKNSDWEKRDKRQVSSADYPMPVPQTDSEAAKGHQISKREITNFDDLIFEDINADAVRSKRESEDSESSEEKSSEESSEKEIETETEAETPEKPEANSGPADWWKVESGLTPNKLDTLIDVVNKINDVFASFIERYDKFHGTSPKETTEEPEIMIPEAVEGGDDKTEAPEISKESKESMESTESSETDKEDTEDSDEAEEGMTEDGDDEADEAEDDKDEDEEEEKDEDDEEEDDEETEDDEAEDKDEEEEDKDEDDEEEEEVEEDEDEDEDEDDEEDDEEDDDEDEEDDE